MEILRSEAALDEQLEWLKLNKCELKPTVENKEIVGNIFKV